MTLKIETGELLAVIACLHGARRVSTLTSQKAINAIDCIYTWMEVTQDHELVRLKAFAPKVCEAYIDMLNSVRQNKTPLHMSTELAAKILLDVLWLENVFTEDVYTRVVSEIEPDKEMEQPDVPFSKSGDQSSDIQTKRINHDNEN